MSDSTHQPDPAALPPSASSFSDVRPYSPVSGSETIVNPEGRPDYAAAADPPPVVPDPSVWQVLFPNGNESDSGEDRLAGVQLAHFAIEERIRSGGMGAVFRARDILLNRVVALKIMPPRQSLNMAAVKRFHNEAQSAAQLDHENIARAYFIGEDKGLHFIAFEFVTGTNIAELIQRDGKLPVDDALNYTLQIASALLHVSERGVVHRDIKPSNIIITTKGRAKLVDMGLARNENRDASADLTVAGTTLGTFDYISPEQAKDPRTVDVRSDIYSLGCTLYHMLTGEAPYPGGTMLQKLLDHQGKDAPDPAEKNSRVSEDFSAIVRKMMASDPKRRYQTADELMRDLMLVAGTMGLRSLSPEGLVWMSSRPLPTPFWERHLPWMSTVAALVVLVVTASVFPQFSSRLNKPGNSVTQHPGDEKAGSRLTGPSDKVPSRPRRDKTEKDFPRVRESATEAKAGGIQPEEKSSRRDDVSSSREASGRAVDSALGTKHPSPSSDARSGFALEPKISGPGGAPHRPGDKLIRPGDELATAERVPPSSRGKGAKSAHEEQATKLGPESIADSNRTGKTMPPKRNSPLPSGEATRDQSRVFVVLGDDSAEGKSYRSLEAACTDAVDGGKIELRFNGIREEKRPILIEEKRIRIRAADGFHPILRFTPANFSVPDYRTRLITVSGGSLELANVNIVLKVDDRFPSERWALFSLDQPESIQMERVTVTVANHNPRHSVTVIEIASNTGTDFTEIQMLDDEPAKPLQIHVAHCVIRGDCDLLTIHRQAALQMTIDESLLALGDAGTVARVTGNMYEPRDEAVFELTLNHVTTLAGGGLLRMTSATTPHKLISVQVTATNNIFSSPRPTPLVAMTGKASVQEFRGLIQWTGKYNYYDRFAEFWTINASSTSDSPSDLDFADWQEWSNEVDAYNNGVLWRRSWSKSRADQLTLADVALDRSDKKNRAVKGTATGTDAGVNLGELPTLPSGR